MLHRILGTVVDFGRSLPFIVLIVLLQQVVTRPLIGPTAAIVPLAIGAVPFLGRLVRSAVREVDAGVGVTRPEPAGDKRVKELAELLTSPQVKDYIDQTFHGSVLPAF